MPGLMDTLSPNGAVRGSTARIIFNYVAGRRSPGLRVFGRRNAASFLNNDLHDQLLGAVGTGGYVVPSGPPVIVVQPKSVNVAIHGSAIIWVVASGKNPLSYQWHRARRGVDEDETVVGATSASLVINDVIEPWDYWVVVTNTEGSVTSDRAEVTASSIEDIMNVYRAKFDTIADMLASDATKWLTAEVANHFPGDGNISIWNVAQSPTILPNGMDVLQTTDPPITVYRTYAKENDGGVVVPGPGLAPYRATVPLEFPTINDLKLSLVTAPKVSISHPDTPYTFVRGDTVDGFTPGTPDDVNEVVNAAGVHYIRWRGI